MTKAKSRKPVAPKKMTCPVCVNGRGQYLDITTHNRKHHGGRTPEAR